MGANLVEDQGVANLGILYAFVVTGGVARPCRGDTAPEEPYDYLWIHVNLGLEAGQRWLREHSGLPPQLAATFCDQWDEMDVQPFGNGTLLIIEDQVKEFNQATRDLAQFHLWVEPKRLLTGRWQPLAAADRVRFRFEVGTPPATVHELLNTLLDEIISDVERIRQSFRKALDTVEDDLLEDKLTGMAAKVGRLRRDTISLRRRVVPLRQVMADVDKHLPKDARPEDRGRLEELQNRIEHASGGVMELQEQSRLLQEELTTRTGERNSQNIYILSVITVLMLPLNLITGFFGMNVGGIPGVGSDDGFTWVTVGMLITSVATWILFKLKKWL